MNSPAATAVASEKLAVQVARHLEREIIARRWPVGEVLGSETDLRTRYGVSRSTLREAVRLLEHSRLAQMRQGPGGGLVVRTPDPRPAVRGLVIYLEYVGATVAQVMGARSIFERLVITAVSDSLTESGIRELRSTASAEADRRPEHFHVTLGRLSGNPALELYVDILTRTTVAYSARARGASERDIEDCRETASRHVQIADAVVAGDESRAQALMTTHIEGIADRLTRLVDPLPGGHAVTRPMDPDPDERPREKKLAESVAGRIHDDIIAEGRRVGEVLGSEADFVARYGVSRSIFRESVRILEHYNVAHMRRGPRGGLVVLAPDPASSLHTVALYMGYRGVTADHLRVVREGVELGCLTAAMCSTRIRREDFAGNNPIGNRRQCRCSTCLRDRIGRLGNDPVLILLRSLLTALWEEHGDDPGPGARCVTPDPATQQQLDAILDAVIDGDEDLAVFRMRKHLRDRTGW
ncbi:FadR/GntR family transcriptional regulator [Rhodococcus gannanensis]|uniref:FadR/GntR family transcriptional regulator n=1 Tax=Rhodococcus gannanensis TaxID=1960308 RepID=A0ABW4P2D3_9NOCA